MFRTEKLIQKLCKTCPFAKSANLLGDSVILFLLKELSSGEKSFSDLEKSLGSVSSRTLTEKLKFLEESKVILRKEESGKPSRVFYSMHEKAKKAFTKVEDSLVSFGKDFFPVD